MSGEEEATCVLPVIVRVYCIACGVPTMVGQIEMALAKFETVACRACGHPIPIAYMPLGDRPMPR